MRQGQNIVLLLVIVGALLPLMAVADRRYFSQEFMGNTIEQSELTSDWGFSGTASNNRFTTASFPTGDVSVVGGQGITGPGSKIIRTVNGLPSHNKLIVRYQLFMFGSWGDKKVTVSVDDGQFTQETTYPKDGLRNVGGNGNSDYYELREFVLPHFAPTAKITFTGNNDQSANDVAWGLRNVEIIYETCEGNCVTVAADLMETTFTKDDPALAKFDFSLTKKDVVTSCGGKSILGGYNGFGTNKSQISRKFDIPFEHTSVRVMFTLYRVDSWDSDDFLTVLADTVRVLKQYKPSASYGSL